MSRELFMMNKLSAIGQRVKEIRKANRLTQAAFAASIGLSQNFLSRVEAGTERLSSPCVLLLAHSYRINERWLRTGEGPMYSDGASAPSPLPPDLDIVTEKILLMLR